MVPKPPKIARIQAKCLQHHSGVSNIAGKSPEYANGDNTRPEAPIMARNRSLIRGIPVSNSRQLTGWDYSSNCNCQ